MNARGLTQVNSFVGFLTQGVAHFTGPDLTTSRQSTDANQNLSRTLQEMDKFTKIEILQIIDLSPRSSVELYTVRPPPSDPIACACSPS